MVRPRKKSRRGSELRLWATSIIDPQLHKDSSVMVRALQEVAETLPDPGPDPDPREALVGKLRDWADRLESDEPPDSQ
jgi:hypothetical protein